MAATWAPVATAAMVSDMAFLLKKGLLQSAPRCHSEPVTESPVWESVFPIKRNGLPRLPAEPRNDSFAHFAAGLCVFSYLSALAALASFSSLRSATK